MKHVVSILLCATATLSTYGIQNDSGAELKNGNINTFYYSGKDKIKLHYDPSKVVVFNFNENENKETSKKRVENNYSGLEYIGKIENSTFAITTYKVKENNTEQLNSTSDIKLFYSYITDEGLQIVPDGDINVLLKHTQDINILLRHADIHNCEFVRRSELNPKRCVLQVTKNSLSSPIRIANIMHESGDFEAVTPSFYHFNMEEISYDTYVNEQWGLYNANDPFYDIDISEAWGYSTGRGIKIAIIDSGIDHNHLDLKDNLSNLSYDAYLKTTPCTQYETAEGHGTHCAGIAAAIRNNNLQICGVAPDAEIINIRHYSAVGNIHDQLAYAIDWACKNALNPSLTMLQVREIIGSNTNEGYTRTDCKLGNEINFNKQTV